MVLSWMRFGQALLLLPSQPMRAWITASARVSTTLPCRDIISSNKFVTYFRFGLVNGSMSRLCQSPSMIRWGSMYVSSCKRSKLWRHCCAFRIIIMPSSSSSLLILLCGDVLLAYSSIDVDMDDSLACCTARRICTSRSKNLAWSLTWWWLLLLPSVLDGKLMPSNWRIDQCRSVWDTPLLASACSDARIAGVKAFIILWGVQPVRGEEYVLLYRPNQTRRR